MSIVSTEIEIDAPVAAVWAVIMDPQRFDEWVTIHRSVQLLTPEPETKGAEMEQVLHLLGLTFKVHWTLAEVHAPRFAEWRGRGPALSHALIRYHLSKLDDQHTLFDYTNEFNTPGGPLAQIANRLVVGSSSEHEARRSLSQLKQLVEHSSR